MPESVTLSDFIDDIKNYNLGHSLTNDISGIVIFDVVNVSGHSWDIIDIFPFTYEQNDISDASITSAYFLPYSNNISLQLNNGITSPNTTDLLDFYTIPSASMQYFTSPRVNINSLPLSAINTNILYRIFENYMISKDYNDIDPIIPPATPETYTTANLPILSAYTPAQVNSLFNTRDEGQRVIETKSEQTIAAEVKKYLNTNGALPQFKNYGDYLAYKNAINLQNGLLQRYG